MSIKKCLQSFGLALTLLLTFQPAGAQVTGQPMSAPTAVPTLPRPPIDASGYVRDPEAMKQHVLRPGDSLEIHVFALAETPSTYTVRADGAFFHPVVGEVLASGKTVATLESEFEARLSKELRNPSFRLGIAGLAPLQVTVLGEAGREGRVDIAAGSTILDVMAAMGGIGPMGDEDNVVVLRGDEQIPVGLEPPVEGEKPFLMKAGDIVYVYRGKSISVTGEVQQPGIYAAGKNDTPLSLLMKAGGAKPNSALGRVKLVRMGLPGPLALDLRPGVADGIPEEAKVLQEGDILVVDVQQVAVIGVGGAKMIPLDGDESLIDVLAAQGVTQEANLSEIAVLRAEAVRKARDLSPDDPQAQELEKIEPEVYDVEKYFRDGELTAHVPIHDGDLVFIPERGTGFFEMLFGGHRNGGLGMIFMLRSLFTRGLF